MIAFLISLYSSCGFLWIELCTLEEGYRRVTSTYDVNIVGIPVSSYTTQVTCAHNNNIIIGDSDVFTCNRLGEFTCYNDSMCIKCKGLYLLVFSS